MAYFLLVLTTLFWSGNIVIAKSMHLQMPPISMSFWRWFVALLILLPWVFPALWAERHLIRQNFWLLLVLSLLGVTNFNSFVYIGLHHTTAVNAVLLQSAIPVLIMLLSLIVLDQKVSGFQCLGICISLAGVITIVSEGQLEVLLSLNFNQGDGWIMAAVFSWALYSVILKWQPLPVTPRCLLGTTIALGVLMLFPAYLLEPIIWNASEIQADFSWNLDNLMTVAYMALFPSILAYFFWNRGVAEFGPVKTGLFIHLMPVFGVLMSVVFLSEPVWGSHLLGISLILLGLYLATLSQFKAPMINNRNSSL